MRECFAMQMRLVVLLFAACQAMASGLLFTQAQAAENWNPAPSLRETGLYSDFASRTIAPENLFYTPQYPLWSDGASKLRWIYLPPGTAIDASNPDAWMFPAGTKIWKEFSFGSRRVETRLMEAIGDGAWRFSTYAWNEDESEAVLVPASGLRGVIEIERDVRHDIPGILDCRACHDTNRTEVLGFSALQLSSGRDPGIPHTEEETPYNMNLKRLIDRGLIRSFPSEWSARQPRIAAIDPIERASLGYLHANCGNCHNPNNSDLAKLGLMLRYSVASGASNEPAAGTGINRTGRYQIPGAAANETFLIRPGDAEHSAVWYRMATRNPFQQMPALGTKIVDAEATMLVRRWIQEVLPGREDVPRRGGINNPNR